MRLRVEWPPQGKAALLRIHWRAAGDVGAAIYLLAETGTGELYKLNEDNNITARLVAGAYHVLLTIDRVDGTIRVWHIYQTQT